MREDCSDPESNWFPQRHICYAKRQQETAERKYGELHKDKPFHDGSEKRWSDEQTPKAPFHFRDGVRVYVAPVDLHPDDDFLT